MGHPLKLGLPPMPLPFWPPPPFPQEALSFFDLLLPLLPLPFPLPGLLAAVLPLLLLLPLPPLLGEVEVVVVLPLFLPLPLPLFCGALFAAGLGLGFGGKVWLVVKMAPAWSGEIFPVWDWIAATANWAEVEGVCLFLPLPFFEVNNLRRSSMVSFKNSWGLLLATCSKNFFFCSCFLSPLALSKSTFAASLSTIFL